MQLTVFHVCTCFLLVVLVHAVASQPVVDGVIYDADGGLCNQWFTHVSAFVIAVEAGAKFVVMPRHAYVRRHKMGEGFSAEPISQVLDVEHAVRYFNHTFGMQVQVAEDGRQYGCEAVFQHLLCARRDTHKHTFQGFYEQNKPACSQDKFVVRVKAGSFSAFTFHDFPVVKQIVAGLRFNSELVAIGDRISRELVQKYGRYNGVHLRVEEESHHLIVSHIPEFAPLANWAVFHSAAQNAGFDNRTALYIASGVYVDDDQPMKGFTSRFAGPAVTKKDFMPANVSYGVDQLAIIDFIVLSKADKMVGYPFSTFTMAIKGYRTIIESKPPSTTILADGNGFLFDLVGQAKVNVLKSCGNLIEY